MKKIQKHMMHIVIGLNIEMWLQRRKNDDKFQRVILQKPRGQKISLEFSQVEARAKEVQGNLKGGNV